MGPIRQQLPLSYCFQLAVGQCDVVVRCWLRRSSTTIYTDWRPRRPNGRRQCQRLYQCHCLYHHQRRRRLRRTTTTWQQVVAKETPKASSTSTMLKQKFITRRSFLSAMRIENPTAVRTMNDSEQPQLDAVLGLHCKSIRISTDIFWRVLL